MDCSLPGSSAHGIFQARILEWVGISYPRGSSQPKDRTCGSWVSCIGRDSLPWGTWEAQMCCCWCIMTFSWFWNLSYRIIWKHLIGNILNNPIHLFRSVSIKRLGISSKSPMETSIISLKWSAWNQKMIPPSFSFECVASWDYIFVYICSQSGWQSFKLH